MKVTVFTCDYCGTTWCSVPRVPQPRKRIGDPCTTCAPPIPKHKRVLTSNEAVTLALRQLAA